MTSVLCTFPWITEGVSVGQENVWVVLQVVDGINKNTDCGKPLF